MAQKLTLERLQKKLTISLQKEVDRLLGTPPTSVQHYRRSYQAEFKNRRVRIISKSTLLKETRKKDVILISDFHTDPQSQRTALRILRDSYQPQEQWIIGLEIFPSNQQRNLDLLIKKKITIKKFLTRVQFNRHWGFPWQNYEPIIQWAIDHGVRVIALDRPKNLLLSSIHSSIHSSIQLKERDLRDRDQWAAGLITDLFAHHQKHSQKKLRFLALYGELHIAKDCIPRQLDVISKSYLGRPLKSVRIFQNHDDLFWKVHQRTRLYKKDVVRLGPDSFCVFSTTPWNKLQSLLSWAEGDHLISGEAPEDEEDYEAMGVDWISALRSTLQTQADFLGVRPRSLDHLIFLTSQNLSATDSSQTQKLLRQLIQLDERCYYSDHNWIWAAQPTYVGLSELAGQVLLSGFNKKIPWFERSKTGITQLVIRFSFSFLMSLLLHPKRKCDLPGDHRQWLQQNRKNKERFEGEKAARFFALEWYRKTPHSPRRNDSDLSLYFGAQFAGRILGRQLYFALLEEKTSASEIRKLYKNSLKKPDERLQSILSIASHLEMNQSKSEIF